MKPAFNSVVFFMPEDATESQAYNQRLVACF
uniref:Uncharacterized protein n=1 Tax=Rhizophora mucronata TaxID=61149 RepID=A0A2P2IJN5_RHIMU